MLKHDKEGCLDKVRDRCDQLLLALGKHRFENSLRRVVIFHCHHKHGKEGGKSEHKARHHSQQSCYTTEDSLKNSGSWWHEDSFHAFSFTHIRVAVIACFLQDRIPSADDLIVVTKSNLS